MALSSQTSRQFGSIKRYSGKRSTGMSRRRRRRQRQVRVVVAFALLFGAVGLIWMWAQGSAEPTEAAASDAMAAGDTGETRTQRPKQPNRSRGTSASMAGGSLSRPLPDGGAAADPVIASSNARGPSAAPERRTPDESPATPAEDTTVITMGDSMKGPSNGDLGPTLEAARQAQEQAGAGEPATTPGPATSPTFDRSGPLGETIAQAERLASTDRPVAARELYNQALWDDRATEADRALLRRRIAELNDALVFGPTLIDGDPLVGRYVVQSGDYLSTIARRESGVDWQFIQRINRITDPGRIRVGQTIKIVKGPIHAVVDKSAFRMDLYAGAAPTMDANNQPAPASSGDLPMYVTSVPVGLGEYGSTPVGSWIVNDTKVENPSWKNPRTGEFFAKDDPDNPVGERWVGLTGTDAETEVMSGYGIHGTVEPESIGQERSMGCIRLNPFDVELVYEMMRPDRSVVLICE